AHRGNLPSSRAPGRTAPPRSALRWATPGGRLRLGRRHEDAAGREPGARPAPDPGLAQQARRKLDPAATPDDDPAVVTAPVLGDPPVANSNGAIGDRSRRWIVRGDDRRRLMSA